MSEYSVDPRTRAGDPFTAAAPARDDRPHACNGGYVFIGHLVVADGEEVEVVDPLPCRRCQERES